MSKTHQHNSHSPFKHSHKFTNKRKFSEQDEDSPILIRHRQNQASSSSKRHQSIQSEFNSSREVHRKWSYSTRDFSGFEDRLVLVSYNILGVKNASEHPNLYCNVSPKYMDWNYRKAAICKELAQYDPSILCLQEVDRFTDLQVSLQQHGFEGILKARTGDAGDGCAVFWKNDRLVLLHEEHIEFQSFGLRNNVSQFCVFERAGTCRRLVVGNIHVLYNPKRGDIKLGQMRLFLEKAYRLSEKWGGIPVVLAGDLNSYPQSAVYQYISSGKLDLLQHARNYVSGQIVAPPNWRTFHVLTNQSIGQKSFGWNDEELELATGSHGVTCLQHNLELHSAYLGVPGNLTTRDDMGEPSGTTCHFEFIGTVDYIWHSKGLVPVRVLETLPKHVWRKLDGLPSENWGSDHLALVCDFAFSDNKEVD